MNHKDNLFPVSELTEAGVRAFQRLLVEARDGMQVKQVKESSLKIARDSNFITVLKSNKFVDIDVKLETRLDVAEFAINSLKDCGIPFSPFSGKERLWSWLALLIIDQICSHKENGQLKVLKDLSRYILSTDYSDYYRHLVAFPAWVKQLHGEHARIFLSQKAYFMPDVVETIASRFDLITCDSVINLIDHLYWANERMAPKVGSTDRPDRGEPIKPGTLRALDLVLSQLGCTYDLRSMSESQILDKLPKEFDTFMNS